MKKLINILSILGIAAALVLIIYVYSAAHHTQKDIAATQKATAFASFPLNEARSVDFDFDGEALDELTNREQMDQMRDWLLFTIVSDAGLSVEEINKSLYDLPATRYGYMSPVANFEYGSTRSCVVGDGQVIALVPKCSTNEQSDYLAHVADEQRKNLGEIPKSLLIFEYELNLDEQFALVTRNEAMNPPDLFTEKYGYYETQINYLADLKNFMEEVHDVTFAQTNDQNLTLGGRKLKSHKYRSIRVEDIAAIWQSEKNLQTKLSDFNARWANKTYRYASERDELLAQMRKEQQELGVVEGSGFSLDPKYDFDGLASFVVEELEPKLQTLLTNDESESITQDFEAAKSGLAVRNIVPYLILNEKLESLLDDRIARILQAEKTATDDDSLAMLIRGLRLLNDLMQDKSTEDGDPAIKQFRKFRKLVQEAKDATSKEYSFQSARYDGDLKGTEVGMVLFYTDLLAKLWALDYMHSSPDYYINDFKAMPALSISPIYQQELLELSSTRLWFGPQNRGFQVANGGNNLIFARNSTRVYAASSNPLKPGLEEAPNAASESFLGWWNNHYEEVARYEQEYERLNEIMKWSLIIGWLNKANDGDRLEFLEDVPVNRSYWFPEWTKQHPNLTFHRWDKVNFYSRGYKGAETESIPLLASEAYIQFGMSGYLRGGVSLASKKLFVERSPLLNTISKLSRRSNLDYSFASFEGNGLRTLEGISYNFETLGESQSLLKAVAKEGSKLRGKAIELANVEINRSVLSEATGLNIGTRVGRAELNSLNITKTANGFKVGLESRALDEGRVIARNVSASANIEKALVENPRVEAALKLSEGDQYLVKLRHTDSWMKMGLEGKPSANIAEGWEARVADFKADHNINLALMDKSTMKSALSQDGWLAAEPVENTGHVILKDISARGPPNAAQAVEIKYGNWTIKSQVDPQTGAVYFQKGELPAFLQKDPSGITKLIRPADLQQLQAKLANGAAKNFSYSIPESRLADAGNFAYKFESKAYDQLARDIVDSPAKVKTQIDRYLTDELQRIDGYLAKGMNQKAGHQLNKLIDTYGHQPDLQLRKGLAELQKGKVEQAARSLNEMLDRPFRNAEFLDDMTKSMDQNERMVAEFGFWHDLQARQHLNGKFNFVADGEKLSMGYQTGSKLNGKIVDPGVLADPNVRIYVQDAPGLNNLDSPVALMRTLDQGISGKQIKVYELFDQDVRQFNPTRIYAADGKTSLKTLNKAGESTNALSRPRVNFSTGGNANQKVYAVSSDTTLVNYR